MKRSEIKKLIDVDQFIKYIEETTGNGNCTILEAIEEYARINQIELDLVASIVRSHKGSLKSTLLEECRKLNLIA